MRTCMLKTISREPIGTIQKSSLAGLNGAEWIYGKYSAQALRWCKF